MSCLATLLHLLLLELPLNGLRFLLQLLELDLLGKQRFLQAGLHCLFLRRRLALRIGALLQVLVQALLRLDQSLPLHDKGVVLRQVSEDLIISTCIVQRLFLVLGCIDEKTILSAHIFLDSRIGGSLAPGLLKCSSSGGHVSSSTHLLCLSLQFILHAALGLIREPALRLALANSAHL